MPAPGLRRHYLPPFRVDLEIRPGVRPPIGGPALARIACAALRAGGAPEPATVGLVLADDIELARLNRAHLGHRGPTDVLSFPLLPAAAYPDHPRSPAAGPDSPGEPARLGGVDAGAGGHARGGPFPPGARDPAFLLPPGTRLHLGDIVISVERAAAQAEDGRGGHDGNRRWDPSDELRLLTVHGALHLCGWDHAEPVEERAMRALERTILGLEPPSGG